MRKGNLVYPAGHIGAYPETGELVSANIGEQAAQALNKAFGAVCTKDPPAKTCIAVHGLPKDAKVEIEFVAVLD